jgi:predicted nucleotidyltransferase
MFLAQTTYSTGAGSDPTSLAVADVNSDSKPDIVVAEYNSNNVGVFLNAGSGTFLAQTTYSTGVGSNPRAVAVVDVNNDNNPDIIVATYGSSSVNVFLNAGSGTFLAQTKPLPVIEDPPELEDPPLLEDPFQKSS